MTPSQLKFFSSLCCPMWISIHYRSGMKSLFTRIDSSCHTVVASANACQVIYWFIYLFYLFIYCIVIVIIFFFKSIVWNLSRIPYSVSVSVSVSLFISVSVFVIPFPVGKDTLCSLKWRDILPLLMSITGATKSKWRTKKLVKTLTK